MNPRSVSHDQHAAGASTPRWIQYTSLVQRYEEPHRHITCVQRGVDFLPILALKGGGKCEAESAETGLIGN